MTIGKHAIKSRSKTQADIALSSGESELYATLNAASEGLGLLSITKDLNIEMSGEVWGDASAALGIIVQNGLGKLRYIDTCLLWIQQVAAERRLGFGKVLGLDNPADLCTKYLDLGTTMRHGNKSVVDFAKGRSSSAPELHTVISSEVARELPETIFEEEILAALGLWWVRQRQQLLQGEFHRQ